MPFSPVHRARKFCRAEGRGAQPGTAFGSGAQREEQSDDRRRVQRKGAAGRGCRVRYQTGVVRERAYPGGAPPQSWARRQHEASSRCGQPARHRWSCQSRRRGWPFCCACGRGRVTTCRAARFQAVQPPLAARACRAMPRSWSRLSARGNCAALADTQQGQNLETERLGKLSDTEKGLVVSCIDAREESDTGRIAAKAVCEPRVAAAAGRG